MSHSEDSVFDETAEIQESGRDWSRFVDLWITSPARIMWTDIRTRIGGAIVLLYILMGTVGVVVVGTPKANEGPRFLSPFQSWKYPLGTDGLGRDLFESIVHATPAMWKMIIAGAIFAAFVGTGVGTVAGLKRGKIDRLLMTVTDIMLTIPGLPLLIVLAVAFEPKDPFLIGLFLAINNWPGLARALRSQVLSLREESYIEASRILGLSTSSIVIDDILPNVMPYILINFVGAANAVIYESVALYYLGVLPWTTINWGVMLNQAQSNGAMMSVGTAHWLLVPLFTITLLSFGMILFSQGLDRVFNPRVRARHAKVSPDVETEQVE